MTSNLRDLIKNYLPKTPEPAKATANRRHRTSSSKETDPAIAQPVAPQGLPAVDTESSARDVVADSSTQATASKKQHQRNSQEMTVLRNQVAELEAALRFADEELRTVKHREQKLLDKVLDKSLDDGFYDSDLIHSFRNIREEIQRLANSPLYATNDSGRRPWVAERHDDHDFYEEWYQVQRKEKQLLSRMHIFSLLCQYIFNRKVFGVSAGPTADRHDKTWFRRIEASLSDFEGILENQGVSEDIITDWRVTTLKCIGLGRFTETPGTEVGDILYRYFERLTREDLSNVELERLRQRFLQLCRETVKLQLRMRNSQEKYECLKIQPGIETASVEDLAEVYAVYNGNKGAIGHQVQFTLFGALVKHPLGQGERRIVLEKAEVVVVPSIE